MALFTPLAVTVNEAPEVIQAGKVTPLQGGVGMGVGMGVGVGVGVGPPPQTFPQQTLGSPGAQESPDEHWLESVQLAPHPPPPPPGTGVGVGVGVAGGL